MTRILQWVFLILAVILLLLASVNLEHHPARYSLRVMREVSVMNLSG